MTAITASQPVTSSRKERRLRRPHRWPLAIVVFGSLLLYVETTARFGHALAVADAHLYYTHAHSWYFDRDCDYENNIADNPTLEVRDYYLAQRSPSGQVVNIFPCGWSVVAMPFLALADGLTILHNSISATSLPRDGHSAYYRAVVPLSHVLLGLIGLWAGYVVTSRYFPKGIAAWAATAVWLGTNASYFISIEPTMSHAGSLGFVALMVLASDNVHRQGWSLPRALALGFSCGMMSAVRHQNIAWVVVPLVLLTPALAQSTYRRSPQWLQSLGLALVSILAFILSLTPQMAVNLATHGSLMSVLAGYMPNWLQPDFSRELFAVPTGLFVLYPLTAICVASGLVLAWRTRHVLLTRALFIGGIALFYMNACAAFGPSRRYACCTVLFMLGLAATLQWARRVRWRFVVASVTVALCCAGNFVLLMMSDRCVIDRELFTAKPTHPLNLIESFSRLTGS